MPVICDQDIGLAGPNAFAHLTDRIIEGRLQDPTSRTRVGIAARTEE
jgi:hypothetical protein